jgi:Tfp pilus assembly protein PilF
MPRPAELCRQWLKVAAVNSGVSATEKTPALPLMAVCGIVLLVYLPVLSAGALCWNDGQYVFQNLLTQNPSLRSAWCFLSEILDPSTVRGYYQPLTMISLMLDCAVGGRAGHLAPFHATSLALHVSNTALLGMLLYLLFGRPWVAAAVAVLFGLHPMTVETVAWVSERKTVLAAFFGFWSLILYVLYTRHHTPRRYWGSLITYVLSVMSKPTGLMLPLAMLVMDYWPLRRLGWRSVREKAPFLVLMVVFGVIATVSQGRTYYIELPGQYDPLRIPLGFCHNVVFYLRHMLWPADLSPHHVFPEILSLANPALRAGVIGTGLLVPLVLLSVRWTRSILAGCLFFLVTILPTMQIVGYSVYIASDKYAYLPAAGLLMTLGSFLVWLGGEIPRASLRAGGLLAVLLLGVTVAEAACTRRYVRIWHDGESLYSHMLKVTPDDASLHCRLGEVLEAMGKLDPATAHFETALRLTPRSHLCQHGLGMNLVRCGRIREGLAHLREAARLGPGDIRVLRDVGWLLATHPDPNVRAPEEALTFTQRAAQLTNHRSTGILDALAAAWAANGQFDQAVSAARKALWVASHTREKKLAREVAQRLELYRDRKLYCEDPVQRFQIERRAGRDDDSPL